MTSDTLDTGGLAPSHAPQPLQALQTLPAQCTAWRVVYGLVGGIVGGAVGCVLANAVTAILAADADKATFSTGYLLSGVAAALVFAAWGLLLAQLRFARYRAEHQPHAGVRLQDGIWWQTETWVPIARLQHLDVRQGPLDRRWGMATLSLHTAGTHDHVLHIKGLPVDQAHALRAALLPQLHAHHV